MKLLRPSPLLFICLAALSAVGQSAGTPNPRLQTPVVKMTGPSSTAVNITIHGTTKTVAMGDLLKLPQITVTFHNASTNAEETYSGPLLAEVIASAGLRLERENEQTFLHSAIVATGSLKFYAIYSLAEVEPAFSSNKVILAVRKSGSPNTEGGEIELINAADASTSRWVHGVANISIVTLGIEGR